MLFKDFQFRKDNKPRRFEELSPEEKECLCQQVYDQQKEEFERNWRFENKPLLNNNTKSKGLNTPSPSL